MTPTPTTTPRATTRVRERRVRPTAHARRFDVLEAEEHPVTVRGGPPDAASKHWSGVRGTGLAQSPGPELPEGPAQAERRRRPSWSASRWTSSPRSTTGRARTWRTPDGGVGSIGSDAARTDATRRTVDVRVPVHEPRPAARQHRALLQARGEARGKVAEELLGDTRETLRLVARWRAVRAGDRNERDARFKMVPQRCGAPWALRQTMPRRPAAYWVRSSR